MKSQLLSILAVAALATVAACDTSSPAAENPDTGTDSAPDTATEDTGQTDARDDTDERDAGPDDAEEPPDAPPASSHRAYLVLHAEPHGDAVCVDGGPWDNLVDVVGAADERGHLLTILFSADWADCITPSPARLDSVAAWVRTGHQIGYHHHDCSHSIPDGYRSPDVEGCNPMCQRCGGKNNGTAAEALAKVREISVGLTDRGVDAAAAAIDTANMGPERLCERQGICFRQYEWDAQLPFGTEQVADNPAPGGGHRFLTSPHCREYGDGTRTFDVVETGHSQLDVGTFVTTAADNNYAALSAELDTLRAGFPGQEVHAGLVFHPQEFTTTPRADTSVAADDRAYLLAVMDLLTEKGFNSVPVRDIVAGSAACQ